MKELIFNTTDEWPGTMLRLVAGLIMLPHGLQKLAGMFGGYGLSATMDYFTKTMKLPWIISFLIILIESFGALGLVAGVFTRVWALSLIIIMTGAIITTNYQNGLFMNWSGNQAGEGYEYHLLFIGICSAILLTGGGKYAVDRLLM